MCVCGICICLDTSAGLEPSYRAYQMSVLVRAGFTRLGQGEYTTSVAVALLLPCVPLLLPAQSFHRTTQAPLIFCDTCPRSYHVCCLGLGLQLLAVLPDWAYTQRGGPMDMSHLPEGSWSCPK